MDPTCIKRSPESWRPARWPAGSRSIWWRGTARARNLAPEVTVWRSADRNDDTVKAYLGGMLSDLVPARGIVIADTEPVS